MDYATLLTDLKRDWDKLDRFYFIDWCVENKPEVRSLWDAWFDLRNYYFEKRLNEFLFKMATRSYCDCPQCNRYNDKRNQVYKEVCLLWGGGSDPHRKTSAEGSYQFCKEEYGLLDDYLLEYCDLEFAGEVLKKQRNKHVGRVSNVYYVPRDKEEFPGVILS